MYTMQENTFVTEAYFRSRRVINGEWQYSECKAHFPNKIAEETALHHHVRQIVRDFAQREV
jgi:hypothetical protein